MPAVRLSEFKMVFWESDAQVGVKLDHIKNDLAKHALVGDGIARLDFPPGANFAVVYPRNIDGDEHGEIIRIRGLSRELLARGRGTKREMTVRFDKSVADASSRLLDALGSVAAQIGHPRVLAGAGPVRAR